MYTNQGSTTDNTGIVEFIAHYQEGNQVAKLHESSRFERENGRWVYVEGNH